MPEIARHLYQHRVPDRMIGGTMVSVVTVEEEIMAMVVEVPADGVMKKEKMRTERLTHGAAAGVVMTVVKETAEDMVEITVVIETGQENRE